MKKVLILLICCFLLSGCLQNGFQVSELKPVNGFVHNSATGSIKNVSNSDCVHAKINIIFSNGSINEDGWISIYVPEKGEIKSFEEETVYGATGITNWTDYKIKVKNVECDTTISDCEEDPNDTWCSDTDYEDDEDY